jgi:hypothetical protein
LDDDPGHASLKYQRRKHPKVMLEDLRSRIARFQQRLDHDGTIRAQQIYPQIFRISG